MSKLIVLFDRPDDNNDKSWLFDLLKEKSDREVVSVSITHILSDLARKSFWGRIRMRHIMICQVIRALFLYRKGDVIICWNCLSGLYMNLALKAVGGGNLIAMCWLTPRGKKTLWPYKMAATNPKCRIVVNSPLSSQQWREVLHLKSTDNFYLIPDVYDTNIPFEIMTYKEGSEKYCFTGGMNNRDWRMILRLARRFRDIRFVCVALENNFRSVVADEDIPANVNVYFDLPSDEYYRLMHDAYLILLPLLDDRVAGLINILRSAQQHTPCLITRTPSTEQYYNADTSCMLIENEQRWEQAVDSFLNMDFETYNGYADKFQAYIKEHCSPQYAVDNILKIIKQISCKS